MTMMHERPGRRSKLAPAVLVSTLSAAALAAAGRPPEVGPNVLVNGPQAGQYGRVGNALAVSEDGIRMVAAWDDMQGLCGPPFNRKCTPRQPTGLTGVAASSDGGRTWTDLGSPLGTGKFITGGHSWLDRGLRGDQETFYMVSRARLVDNDSSFFGQIGILLHRGRFENGRFVWKDTQYFGPTAGQNDYWRGPSVAAAKDGSGKVYIAFTSLGSMCGRIGVSGGAIKLMHSEDGGDTWSDPVVVSADDTLNTTDPKDPRCGTWTHFQFTPSIGLGPSSEVYLTWQFGPEIIVDWGTFNNLGAPTVGFGFSRSLDGGLTFSHPRYAAIANSISENAPAGFSKDVMSDTPRLAVARGGPWRGRIYVTYATTMEETSCRDDGRSPKSYNPLSTQVYLIWSDNQGNLWSGPVPLGPPVPRTGVKRFFPAVAVRADGTVDVVYLESRETPPGPGQTECRMTLGSGLFKKSDSRSLVDLWSARSADGGASFGEPVRVTSATSDWCDVQFDSAGFLFANFGDYLGIVGGRDRTSLVWTDGRNGVPDAYFTSLGERR
jgi:hypothetical protein